MCWRSKSYLPHLRGIQNPVPANNLVEDPECCVKAPRNGGNIPLLFDERP